MELDNLRQQRSDMTSFACCPSFQSKSFPRHSSREGSNLATVGKCRHVFKTSFCKFFRLPPFPFRVCGGQGKKFFFSPEPIPFPRPREKKIEDRKNRSVRLSLWKKLERGAGLVPEPKRDECRIRKNMIF